MDENCKAILNTLRQQALYRAIAELESAQHTFYNGESIHYPLYTAIDEAIRLIKDNR